MARSSQEVIGVYYGLRAGKLRLVHAGRNSSKTILMPSLNPWSFFVESWLAKTSTQIRFTTTLVARLTLERGQLGSDDVCHV